MKKPMAAWYDPGLLLATGIRSVISTLFGEFADKREAIAAANAIQPTPRSTASSIIPNRNPDGDFWFDYLADTGDGWNPTYRDGAAARRPRTALTRRASCRAGGCSSSAATRSIRPRRARNIATGSSYPFDQAYWPERRAALAGRKAHGRTSTPIPGNHDWYDGLNSFFGLFCRRRVKPDGRGRRQPRRQGDRRPPDPADAQLFRDRSCPTTGGCGARTASSKAISTSRRSTISSMSPRTGWSRDRS